MLSFKHTLTVVLKPKEWLSSKAKKKKKKNIKLTIMPKPHLQTITKGPAKFQIDRYKTVGGVARTRYPPSVVKCLSRKRGLTKEPAKVQIDRYKSV